MNNNNSIKVVNPVLPGFHPDPSICKVGDDYFIATSTFEYFPGVAIHRSINLLEWELCSYALTRKSQLNMSGNPSSGGVWAPCLSYDRGKFYLIYTDVKSWSGAENTEGFKDTHNYLTTAPSIAGPWSEPVYLNSSGFDPSLFHDEDGRKWLVNVQWDYRPWKHSFNGIVLQEFDEKAGKLFGPIKNIFKGSDLKLTEAPHLYKRNGWYYLMTAEGGTSYMHAVTLARSRDISGPYELHPHKHLLTSLADRELLERNGGQNGYLATPEAFHEGLLKAGHASMAPWTEDEWVLAHLAGRPLEGTAHCPLGRETALQKIVWKEDDWPYLVGDGASIEVEFSLKEGIIPIKNSDRGENWRDDFDGPSMDLKLNTLRNPVDDSYSLTDRPGWLRLYGAESPVSMFKQVMAVRRVQHFIWSARTVTDYSSDTFQKFAGLIVRYDETMQHILRISDQEGKRTLGLISYDLNHLDLPLGENEIELPEGPVYLAIDVYKREMQFSYSLDGNNWIKIGPLFDASKLSDDYVKPMGFTGTYVGVGAWDVSGQRHYADFGFLEYKGRE